MSSVDPPDVHDTERVQTDPSDTLLWGTPYRTLRRQGGADHSETLRAEHLPTGRQVLVKILRLGPDLETEAVEQRRLRGERVRLEAETLSRLRHPNLVSVLDMGQAPDGRPYLVTEPLEEARSLREVLAEHGALPASEAVAIALDVLAALTAAHELGVIHRDVTPQNILLVGKAQRVVKLTDFGLAKVVAERSGGPSPIAKPTEPGAHLGSPRYLSPDLALGRRLDERSDLYQVGLVLFEMVSGRGPFEDHHGLQQLLRAHTTVIPPRLSAVAEQPISGGLDGIVARALSKLPTDRHASAAELAAALRRGVDSTDAPAVGHGAAAETEVLDRDALRRQLERDAAAAAPAQLERDDDAATAAATQLEREDDVATAAATQLEREDDAATAAATQLEREDDAPTDEPGSAGRMPALRLLLWVLGVLLVFGLGFVVARLL